MEKPAACSAMRAGSNRVKSTSRIASARASTSSVRDQDAGLAVDHRLADAPLVDADHRPAGRLALHRRHSELLDVGHHQARARA